MFNATKMVLSLGGMVANYFFRIRIDPPVDTGKLHAVKAYSNEQIKSIVPVATGMGVASGIFAAVVT